jgi:YidC/Oxa1 family membrane protein insertase
LFYKGAKDQTIIQRLAPKIREIQQTHKDDKQEQTKKMLALYKEHKVNPFSSIGLLLLQLPILWALYRVFLGGFSATVLSELYSFIPQPAVVNYHFLGIIALQDKNFILVLIAAVFQFLQTYFLMKVSATKMPTVPDDNPAMAMAQKMSKRMMYFAPLLTLLILSGLPSAIALYWLTTSAFSTVQQLVINKKIKSNDQQRINTSGN